MNAFDYFFENTFDSEKLFLVGKEETSFKQLYNNCISLANNLNQKIGKDQKILLLSENNKFCITAIWQ